MHKVPTKKHSLRTRRTWRDCAFVFAGVAVAVAASAGSVALGWGLNPTGPVWLGALGWTVLALFANGLWRGARFGDGPLDGAAERAHERRRGDELSYRWRTDPSYSCLPGNTFHSSRH